jgi:antitoxin (DNA-binding transcriptional repressor) of toxin-antitoxin stability system
MRKASIGEVQHNLSSLLGYIEQGEEILLTKRNRVIAKISPASEPGGVELPDFNERSRQMFPRPKGKVPSRIILEDRNERL